MPGCRGFQLEFAPPRVAMTSIIQESLARWDLSARIAWGATGRGALNAICLASLPHAWQTYL